MNISVRTTETYRARVNNETGAALYRSLDSLCDTEQDHRGVGESLFQNGRVFNALFRFEQPARGWNWSLSPDGTTIAAAELNSTNREIHLISLNGQPPRIIALKEWSNLLSLDWAADAKGFFISSKPTGQCSALLYVDLAGNAHSLLQLKNFQASWGIPSHDGKYVAIAEPTIECNAWMVEIFEVGLVAVVAPL